jgi:cytochrome c553
MGQRSAARNGRQLAGVLAALGASALALLVRAPARGADGGPARGTPPRFERDVAPILAAHCFKCHGAQTRKNGLDLRSLTLMLQGGDSGPVLSKGSAEDSLLFEQVSTRAMPPGQVKLSDDQIGVLRAWIDGGAVADHPDAIAAAPAEPRVTESDRRFWAFRPLARPAVPRVQRLDQVRTPIDAFVLAKLEARGLGLSSQAKRVALIRRASFDVLGLPPAPEEVDAFLADDRPDAYERLIDRLLASPHYGERWGRHWLDAAGYADVAGTDNDAGIVLLREGLWRYRDYVVGALNADKPYDRFVAEQLAGDELTNWRSAPRFDRAIEDLLVATGFLRTAIDDTAANELNLPLHRFQVVHDTIETVASNLLGLTVGCARCHDHKFDPIPQRDYYRLMALLTPAYNPQAWKQPPDRTLPDVSPAEKAEIERGNAEIERQVGRLNEQEAGLRRPYEARLLETKLAAIPEPIRADTRAAVAAPKDKRSPIQAYLAEKLGPHLRIAPEEVARLLSAAEGARLAELARQRSDLTARKRSFGTIQALIDVGPPPVTHLLKRGNYETPGPVVEPGFLSVLEDAADPGIATAGAAGTSSGRRLALARWLTLPGSPAAALVARVLVNRVWQHHFGRGIAATPGNFGRMGAAPTHPELLEWLAAEFVESGWRIKPLHRRILTSAVYRQASHRPAPPADQARGVALEALDPDNQLLGRMPLRRLEAEAVRDALLAASGALDRAEGGPPVPLEARADGMIVVDEKHLPAPTARWRRSLYILARRNYPLSLLGVFDEPVMTGNCTRRVNSAVPLQALTMMNNAFVWDQAERLAQRVARSADPEPARRIELAFRLALARRPTRAETAWSAALLDRQAERLSRANPQLPPEQAARHALAHLGLMLFNTNEFLYLE